MSYTTCWNHVGGLDVTHIYIVIRKLSLIAYRLQNNKKRFIDVLLKIQTPFATLHLISYRCCFSKQKILFTKLLYTKISVTWWSRDYEAHCHDGRKTQDSLSWVSFVTNTYEKKNKRWQFRWQYTTLQFLVKVRLEWTLFATNCHSMPIFAPRDWELVLVSLGPPSCKTRVSWSWVLKVVLCGVPVYVLHNILTPLDQT